MGGCWGVQSSLYSREQRIPQLEIRAKQTSRTNCLRKTKCVQRIREKEEKNNEKQKKTNKKVVRERPNVYNDLEGHGKM